MQLGRGDDCDDEEGEGFVDLGGKKSPCINQNQG